MVFTKCVGEKPMYQERLSHLFYLYGDHMTISYIYWFRVSIQVAVASFIISTSKQRILTLFEAMFWEVELSWETFEIKDAKRCILTLFETMFWKLALRRNFWKQGCKLVHTNAIDSMFSEVATAENSFKTKSINCAFFRNLKRCFWSLNCWEN